MFLFKSMVYSGLSSCQTSRPASSEYSPKSILVYFNKFKKILTKYYFQSTVFTCYITMDEPSTSTVSILLLFNYIKYHIHHIKNLSHHNCEIHLFFRPHHFMNMGILPTNSLYQKVYQLCLNGKDVLPFYLKWKCP